MKKTATFLVFMLVLGFGFSASAQWTTKQTPGTGVDYVHSCNATRLVASLSQSLF